MDPDSTGSQGSSGVKIVTRKYLFGRLRNLNLPNLEEKLNVLCEQLLGEEYTADQIQTLKRNFAWFKCQIKQRWSKAHKKENIFLKDNHSWLEGTFEIPVASQRSGRPRKSFGESSDRTKRRKTEEVRSTWEKDVLIHAAQVELYKAGKRDASEVLKDLTSSPSRARKYKRAFSQSRQEESRCLTPLQALSMFIEADLTRHQYEVIRNTNKKFFPCYSILQKAKKECYPPVELCKITSTSAESNLQSLVDLTVKRLSISLEEVLMTVKEHKRDTLKIICKWGCDGSQQSKFKQKFENDADSDANLFQSCFVPLRLVSGKKGENILWENPTPSSPRYCRPIRLRFIKESTDVTEEEIEYIKQSANSLCETEVELNGNKFSVKHVFIMTMVDGKVCNAATGTKSTSQCYVCGATSQEFNKLELGREICAEATEFGLSILHARIRIFESLLHLAYKLPVRKYRKRKTEEEKKLENDTKLKIQEKFRKEIGLLVDIPKANFGNTNDGNTSRRFFDDPKLAHEITGINYDLIYRFKVILQTISSGHIIDTEKYNEYAFDTARLYVDLYDWHPMSPTMHKILIHGGTIIKNALLPIGQLSEEAAEARNKHFRTYRQNFSRKFSRDNCNRDIFNRLLLSSDPLLSSMRSRKQRRLDTFLPETIHMLLPPKHNVSGHSSESEDGNLSGESISILV